MRLPILASVPHAGLEVPAAWRPRCVLGPKDIEADSDGQAAEIYRMADLVEDFLTTDVARAVVDLNRAPDDRRPDGAVKTMTCWEVPVWDPPLDEDEARTLLEAYHRPYHERLSRPQAEVHCGVDLHTMAARAPPVAPDPGAERPAVCLSNAGGTAPDAWMTALADAFEDAMEIRPRINDPFQGGHITRHHAKEMPWLQVEMSRGDFLDVDAKRDAVRQALPAWCEQVFGQEPLRHSS